MFSLIRVSIYQSHHRREGLHSAECRVSPPNSKCRIFSRNPYLGFPGRCSKTTLELFYSSDDLLITFLFELCVQTLVPFDGQPEIDELQIHGIFGQKQEILRF